MWIWSNLPNVPIEHKPRLIPWHKSVTGEVTVNGDEDATAYRTSANVIDIEASLAAGWGLKHVLGLGICLHS